MVAGRDLELQLVVRAIAQLLHDLARFGAVLLDIGAVARDLVVELLGQAPDAVGRRLHDAADVGLALGDDVDEGLAVEAEQHGAPHVGIVERRCVAVQDQVGVVVHRRDLADGVRRLRLHVLDQRNGDAVGRADVVAARHEAQDRRATRRHDRDLDTVEIGLALLEVVGIADELDAFLLLELGELEGAGADRLGAHLRRRHVAGIDGAVAGRQQHQERGLRLAEMESHLAVAIGRDLIEIPIPRGAGILAQLLGFAAAGQHVPGALHVGGGEGLAVVPFGVADQLEGEVLAVGAPAPALGEVGTDRLQAVLGNLLIEQHEIVVEAHERHDRRGRGLLVDRGAGRVVLEVHLHDTAALLCEGGCRHQAECCDDTDHATETHVVPPCLRCPEGDAAGRQRREQVSG